MPGSGPIIYLDSCVLISYIDGDADRLPVIEELFRRSRASEIELITSAVTQVEVAFDSNERAAGELEPTVEAAIDELWRPGSPLEMVEFYEQIGLRARELIRFAVTQGWRLTPLDAIHIATAERLGAERLFTYDDRLPRYSQHVGISIEEPFNPQPTIPGTEAA